MMVLSLSQLQVDLGNLNFVSINANVEFADIG